MIEKTDMVLGVVRYMADEYDIDIDCLLSKWVELDLSSKAIRNPSTIFAEVGDDIYETYFTYEEEEEDEYSGDDSSEDIWDDESF
tara:strand:- start:455 stop:709 length:255 start_codon:yes stop_codon:yes gene_type:complete